MHLPDQLAGPLIAAARSAFTDGLAVAAVVSAPVLLLLAVLSVVLLGRATRQP
jgi:hypothetical protein